MSKLAFALLMVVATPHHRVDDPPWCVVPAGQYAVCSLPQSNMGVHRTLVFGPVPVEDDAWGFYVEYTFERKDEGIILLGGSEGPIAARSNSAFSWWR